MTVVHKHTYSHMVAIWELGKWLTFMTGCCFLRSHDCNLQPFQTVSNNKCQLEKIMFIPQFTMDYYGSNCGHMSNIICYLRFMDKLGIKKLKRS